MSARFYDNERAQGRAGNPRPLLRRDRFSSTMDEQRESSAKSLDRHAIAPIETPGEPRIDQRERERDRCSGCDSNLDELDAPRKGQSRQMRQCVPTAGKDRIWLDFCEILRNS